MRPHRPRAANSPAADCGENDKRSGCGAAPDTRSRIEPFNNDNGSAAPSCGFFATLRIMARRLWALWNIGLTAMIQRYFAVIKITILLIFAIESVDNAATQDKLTEQPQLGC
jgi:hypothetical protein